MEKKIDYINAVGLDFYVDDNPSFLEKSKECHHTIIVKMNWAYNEEVKILNVPNVTAYLDLIYKVKAIKEN